MAFFDRLIDKAHPGGVIMYRWLLAVVGGCLLAASAAWAAGDAVRPDRLAGTWYPGQADKLAESMVEYLAGAPKEPPTGMVAIVTPHAGHIYSGAVAGTAWGAARAMQPQPATVVLIGPSHRYPLTKPSIWPTGAYDSPLGPVAVDQELAAQLTAALGAEFMRAAHLSEHCLEVQIPFIKSALPKAKIVAVLTGPPNPAEAKRLGRALAQAVKGKPVLLAVSCDMSHFHTQARARQLDGQAAKRIKALDPDGLLGDVSEGKAEACGIMALAMVMHAARELGAGHSVVLAQDDSGRATGDTGRVVGYLAAAMVKGPAPADKKPALGFSLSDAQKDRLRILARASLEAAVHGKPLPDAPSDDPVLANPPGRVFVTLKERGHLRGCLGHLGDDLGLAQAVITMAAASALRDPRFRPVTPDELPHISLEISVLTPFTDCTADQVRVGVDGLIVRRGWKAGLLLPQVPGEQGWDLDAYLRGICRKAGMESGCWRYPGAKLQRFQALVF